MYSRIRILFWGKCGVEAWKIRDFAEFSVCPKPSSRQDQNAFRTMSDDTTVLLEEKSYIVEMDHPTQENVQEEPTGDYEEDHFEVVVEVESGPYGFLRNWNSVGVWMCAVYNFCVLLLLITVYVYKRKN